MNELQVTLLAIAPMLGQLTDEELSRLSVAATLNEQPTIDFDTEYNTLMVAALFDRTGKMHDLTRQAVTLYAKRSLDVGGVRP